MRVASYTASKSALAGLTRLMANELAHHGINVNAIAPGYMATENTAQLRADADRNRSILERIPAGRWGETDLANPDFPALARAFGARGERVGGVDALGGALTTALAADGPTVLELRMAVDPPWEI